MEENCILYCTKQKSKHFWALRCGSLLRFFVFWGILLVVAAHQSFFCSFPVWLVLQDTPNASWISKRRSSCRSNILWFFCEKLRSPEWHRNDKSFDMQIWAEVRRLLCNRWLLCFHMTWLKLHYTLRRWTNYCWHVWAVKMILLKSLAVLVSIIY